jgi:SOS-response transcriptional repressor LexA
MTRRQREVLNWLIHFMEANGYAPTLAQIGAGIGTTFQGARAVLRNLERQGAIKRTRSPRNLEILRK